MNGEVVLKKKNKFILLFIVLSLIVLNFPQKAEAWWCLFNSDCAEREVCRWFSCISCRDAGIICCGATACFDRKYGACYCCPNHCGTEDCSRPEPGTLTCIKGFCGAECSDGETKSCTKSYTYMKCIGNCCRSVTENFSGTQYCQSDCTWGDCIVSSRPPDDQCLTNADCGGCNPGATRSCTKSCTYKKCVGSTCTTVTETVSGTQTCQLDCTWGPCDAPCPSDQCSTNADCCINECSPSGKEEYRCSGNTVQKRTCGDYDADPCLEWSSWTNVENCDSYDTACRDYYCSNGSCQYTNEPAGTSCGTCKQCDGSGNCVGITASDGPNCTGPCTKCSLGSCVSDPSHCSDGIQNCGETGIDCGGTDCPPCNQPPSAKNLYETQDRCAWGSLPQVAPGLAITLNWNYSDPDGDSQSAYEIWLDNDSSFSDPKFNHLVENNSATSYALDLNQDDNHDWLNQLNWNTTYYWKVRVKDSKGNWSNGSAIDTFTTPSHPSPYVNFKWVPQKPTVNEVVQFCSVSTATCSSIINQDEQSKCFNLEGNPVPCFSFNWTFQNGNPPSSNLQNPTTTFILISSNKVTLNLTDPFGYSCSATKTVTTTYPLPKWREIAPYPLFQEKIFASLADLLKFIKTNLTGFFDRFVFNEK